LPDRWFDDKEKTKPENASDRPIAVINEKKLLDKSESSDIVDSPEFRIKQTKKPSKFLKLS